jgi:hypothetical protein
VMVCGGVWWVCGCVVWWWCGGVGCGVVCGGCGECGGVVGVVGWVW